jgi:hypothetical protein
MVQTFWKSQSPPPHQWNKDDLHDGSMWALSAFKRTVPMNGTKKKTNTGYDMTDIQKMGRNW